MLVKEKHHGYWDIDNSIHVSISDQFLIERKEILSDIGGQEGVFCVNESDCS